MRKFVLKIFLFLSPILIGLTIVFIVKADREFCYNYIKGDCDARGKLFYKRMYQKPNTIDYLFIGSSKTMNGINDGLIEDSINNKRENKIRFYNAGYCRFGRNLDFLFMKEFISKHKIKKVFLEVRANESTSSHPIFPYLANAKAIAGGVKALNGKLFSEIYNHELMNLNFLRCKAGIEKAIKNNENIQWHGYNNINHIMNEKELREISAKEIEKLKKKKIDKNAFEYVYSETYLEKMKAYCDKNNIELVFIYLPSFGNQSMKPFFLEEYEKMGKVIFGPDSIYQNPAYWKDVAHFNTSGATAYSKFLAKELSR